MARLRCSRGISPRRVRAGCYDKKRYGRTTFGGGVQDKRVKAGKRGDKRSAPSLPPLLRVRGISTVGSPSYSALTRRAVGTVSSCAPRTRLPPARECVLMATVAMRAVA